MKILAFCFFPAFVPPSNGGQSRLFNFYRSLSKMHQVTLLTSTNVGVEEECVIHGAGFIERRIPKDDYFVQEYARLEQHAGGGDLSGPAIAACGKFPTRLHQAYLEEYEKVDLIIHDSPFTTEYDIFSSVDNKPRIYNAYNCESQLYLKLHPAKHSKPIHEVVQQAEVKMLSVSDLVLYCNEIDLKAFYEIKPGANFTGFYAPNGMQPLATSKLTKKKRSDRFHAVFMGSAHPPNANAAEFIVTQLAPHFPSIDFDIIGSCLSESYYLPNVHRYGIVSDAVKHQVLSKANLALNPMASGSGSNVKVLDYFSHGIPVLSTSFGMRGIQAEVDKDYLEADLDLFASALKSAIENFEMLAKIGQSGKALALKHYTWDGIVSKVAAALEELLSSKINNIKKYVLALNDYDSFASIGGGGTRTRGLYGAVSKWSPVVFVSFSDNGSLQARQIGNNITVINVPKTREHLAELSNVNVQYHISADDIIASRHCTNNPFLSAIYRILRENARSIVLEHCYMAALPNAWGDRFVYSSQNHEEALKSSLLVGHPLKDSLLRDVEILERFALENSAAIIAVSAEDAESLVKKKRAVGPTIVVRNGAALPVRGKAVEKIKAKFRNEIGDRAVVFLGSAHMPNVEACNYITEHLANQCPNIQFHILGSVCDVFTKVRSNVKLWGVVDDETKSAVMQSCALAINPMLSGSGSNVKLADYIGNGLYVVTTEFGQRGYPDSVKEHISIVSINSFGIELECALKKSSLRSELARLKRETFFNCELSIEALATRFVEMLQGLEIKKKRVLYVAYRYVSPAMGGAEVNLEKFVTALGYSGQFEVDVIAPEVSFIKSHWRFGEHYTFDSSQGVPIDIPNVRFARFPLDTPDEKEMLSRLRQVWQFQPSFECAVNKLLSSRYTQSGLTWGWGYPEGSGELASRWAFADCGLHLKTPARVVLEGYTPHEVVISMRNNGALLGTPQQFSGKIKLELDAPAGELVFETSTKIEENDPRPLGFNVSRILINDQLLELSAPLMWQSELSVEPAVSAFRILDKAAESTRTASDATLTTTRGPWSTSMERFIADHVAKYDVVISNNNVFRPAVVAMAEAKRQGVPSILIPHAHLDDDFYHFPDLLQSARDASLVLAVPKAACDFLAEKGCNVRYLPAGCDTKEKFTSQDIQAFRGVYSDQTLFILVLGRKAEAKCYSNVIEAVDQLNHDGLKLRAVLIGPDDDGLPITSPNASYLGWQPRDVVRGALQSCFALCNMSSSESFGIVLLEAWLAGKPVIANKNCGAFHDMAVDNQNSLLVDQNGIVDAIRKMLAQPDLGPRLAQKGNREVTRFDWDSVAAEFVIMCTDITQTIPKG